MPIDDPLAFYGAETTSIAEGGPTATLRSVCGSKELTTASQQSFKENDETLLEELRVIGQHNELRLLRESNSLLTKQLAEKDATVSVSLMRYHDRNI